MKRMLSCILVVIICLSMILSVAAENSERWDLEQMPELTGMVLGDLLYNKKEDNILTEPEEEERAIMAQRAAEVLKQIEFAPYQEQGDNIYSKLGISYDIMSLRFCEDADDWSKKRVEFHISKKGVYIEVWDENGTQHCAFVLCETENLILRLETALADLIQKGEEELKMPVGSTPTKPPSEAEETSEKKLTEFKKLYTAAMPQIVFTREDNAVQLTRNAEVGICTYREEGAHTPVYAYYICFASPKYYISDSLNHLNEIVRGNLKEITQKDDVFYLNEGKKNITTAKVKFIVDKEQKLQSVNWTIETQLGFTAEATRDEFIESGVWKQYGSLKLPQYMEVAPQESAKSEELKKEDKSSEDTDSKNLLEEPIITENIENKEADTEDVSNKASEGIKQVENNGKEIAVDEAVEIIAALNLFRRTDVGYELDSPLTRAQAAAMLVRLLGQEKKVLGEECHSIFSDVADDHWAAGYIMYCSSNNITKGTSDNTFTPDRAVSASEFITLLLRLLGYESEPDTAFADALDCKLFDAKTKDRLEEEKEFCRSDMAVAVYCALKTKCADGKLLAERLIEKDAISVELAQKLGLI